MPEDLFGPLTGTWNVEQAAIAVLREWMPVYLAAIERKNGLANRTLGRPVTPQGYYGGIDFQSELPGKPPAVIVVVNPQGEPKKTSTGYTQAYEVGVGCIIVGATEEEARRNASLFGNATLLIAQLPSLAGLAEETVMSASPKLEWVDPDAAERRLVRSVTTFTTWVSNIVEVGAGPVGETIAGSPEIQPGEPEAPPTERPVVTATSATVDGEEL